MAVVSVPVVGPSSPSLFREGNWCELGIVVSITLYLMQVDPRFYVAEFLEDESVYFEIVCEVFWSECVGEVAVSSVDLAAYVKSEESVVDCSYYSVGWHAEFFAFFKWEKVVAFDYYCHVLFSGWWFVVLFPSSPPCFGRGRSVNKKGVVVLPIAHHRVSL